MDNSKVIALLIDAENVSPKYIKTIIDEVSMYGSPAIKRIYGDWTSPDMSSWKKALNEHNIQPVQQFSYTQGKNASDSALIIDAMDILYGKNVDGFCLVSSDSDFTRLAARLRESRMFVIGMGESKTPTAFKAACDTFKYLDLLMGMKVSTAPDSKAKLAEKAKAAKKPAPSKAAPAKKADEKPAANVKAPIASGAAAPVAVEAKPIAIKAPEPLLPPAAEAETEPVDAIASLSDIVEKIREIIEFDSDEDGFMPLSQVGVMLSRLYADFDARNYGYSKLHKLVDATGAFATQYQQFGNGGKNLVVRNK